MAFAPELLKDVNTAPDTHSSSPRDYLEVAGVTYFIANDFGGSGRSVWRTDGTSEGTRPVLDSSVYDGVYGKADGPLVEAGGKFYFSASSEEHGRAIWVSDGTSAGTHFAAMPPNARGLEIENLTNVDGTLYFTTDVTDLGAELWKWDRVSDAPQLVKDIVPGIGGPAIVELTNVNGELFFIAAPFERRHEYLMKTDGTAEGTVVLADVDLPPGETPGGLTNFNGRLLFSGPGGLWTSDGSTTGTKRIADVGSSVYGITKIGNQVYFSAGGSRAIWHSDGTPDGSSPISFASNEFVPGQSIVGIGDTAYFVTTQSAAQLFRIDPVSFEATLVTSQPPSYSNLVEFEDQLFFFSRDTLGPMLWRSDGTDAGTSLVFRFRETTDSNAAATRLFVGDQQLFMTASDALHGFELWSSDGTPAGSGMVKDLINESMGSSFAPPAAVGDTLYFSGDDGIHGLELWKSDGTAAGTQMVKDYSAGVSGSGPYYLADLNGLVVFTQNSSIMRSNGTAAGTFKLANRGTNPRVTGDLLYFLADPSGNLNQGAELWRSDGSLAGTYMLKDIRPGNGSSGVTNRVSFNGKVYFAANDGNGYQLWSTDGTTAGTTKASQISAGTNNFLLTVFNGAIYFARQNSGGMELWKSDGSIEGTRLLQILAPAGEFALTTPRYSVSEGHLFLMFSTAQSVHSNADNGYELWAVSTDDEEARRLAVLPGLPPPTVFPAPLVRPTPDFLGALGNSVLFTAHDPEHGVELWTSDGTVAGTHIVKDILGGALGSEPTHATLAGDQLYFAAHGPAGIELWRTDGTSEGTVEAYDFRYGDSRPGIGTLLNGAMYINVNADRYGREVWKVDRNDAPQLAASASSTVFVEGSGAVFVDTSAALTDVDNPVFGGGKLAVEITANAAPNDRLLLRPRGNGLTSLAFSSTQVFYGGVVVGTWAVANDGHSLEVNLNDSASLAAVRALVRSVSFSNSDDAPDLTPRTISFVLHDGDGPTPATMTKTVSVQATNDAPVLNIGPLPALPDIPEDALNPAGTLVSDLLGAAVSGP